MGRHRTLSDESVGDDDGGRINVGQDSDRHDNDGGNGRASDVKIEMRGCGLEPRSASVGGGGEPAYDDSWARCPHYRRGVRN